MSIMHSPMNTEQIPMLIVNQQTILLLWSATGRARSVAIWEVMAAVPVTWLGLGNSIALMTFSPRESCWWTSESYLKNSFQIAEDFPQGLKRMLLQGIFGTTKQAAEKLDVSVENGEKARPRLKPEFVLPALYGG